MQTTKHDLETMMRGLAARDYQRRHPGATTRAAWEWAHRNSHLFVDQAVTVLTMIELDRQTAAEARDRIN